MCIRCFRSREGRHRLVELHEAACGKTLEQGKESGGKSDHVALGGEKSGTTSWRQWHFASLLVKNQGGDGEGNHNGGVWT